MKKIILTLIFSILFALTASGAEGRIYLNDEIMEFQSYIDDDGTIYIPIRIYENLCGSEIIWNPESKEIVMLTPFFNSFTNGAPRYDSIFSNAEMRILPGSLLVSSRMLDFVTGEYMGSAGEVFGFAIIKNDRAMIPLIQGENIPIQFENKTENKAKISFMTAHIFYRDTYIDRNSDVYFYDEALPIAAEKYLSNEINPDKWVWAGDENYIKQAYEQGQYDEHGVFHNYLHMSFETDSGEEIYCKFPLPSSAQFRENEGIARSEGIMIKQIYGDYFFDKEEFLRFLDKLLSE